LGWVGQAAGTTGVVASAGAGGDSCYTDMTFPFLREEVGSMPDIETQGGDTSGPLKKAQKNESILDRAKKTKTELASSLPSFSSTSKEACRNFDWPDKLKSLTAAGEATPPTESRSRRTQTFSSCETQNVQKKSHTRVPF